MTTKNGEVQRNIAAIQAKLADISRLWGECREVTKDLQTLKAGFSIQLGRDIDFECSEFHGAYHKVKETLYKMSVEAEE